MHINVYTYCFDISNADSQGYSQRHSTTSYDHHLALRNFARRYNYLVDLFPKMVFVQFHLKITKNFINLL